MENRPIIWKHIWTVGGVTVAILVLVIIAVVTLGYPLDLRWTGLRGTSNAGPNAPLNWLDQNRQPGKYSTADLFPLYIACSTANSMPVTFCNDWLTGPGSSENSQLQMFYGDRAKKPWSTGVLKETDGGLPIMSPDGKQLKLMVFGDTFVANPSFTLNDHKIAVKQCMNTTESSFCSQHAAITTDKYNQCLKLFTDIQPKANACTYFHADKRTYPVFFNPDHDNVTIFDAEIAPSSAYHIKFKDHLYNKIVRHGEQDGVDAFSNSWFTGVYGLDYFYTCPGNATKCEDAEKLLYFLTATIFWEPTNGNPSGDQMLYTKLSREGMGFYRFGKLDASISTTSGCRLRYGPKPSVDHSCVDSTRQWLQPLHPHSTKISNIERPDNVHVYWGKDTKFSVAITAHDYVDPYHSGSLSSSEYIYFIGSGETDFQNKPTGKIYLARLPASEEALFNAKFEYFTGTGKSGASQWGSYTDAELIFLAPIYWVTKSPLATSFTKRFGKYYLASTCYHSQWPFSPAYGMCVASSNDGITWQGLDFALYSDIIDESLGSVKLGGVYGHIWVPGALYPAENEIAYIFSVWKSPKGYFKDVYRLGGPESHIKAEHLFYRYNTKVYLYRPK